MTFAYRHEAERVAALALPWEKLEGKTLLISGGTGLIGRFLLDVVRCRNRAGSNIRVVSLSRRPRPSEENIVYLEQDVSKPIAYDGAADYVLHLASNTHPKQYGEDPVGTITTNIFGCYHLLEKARACGAQRFLLASSVEIYGDGDGTPMDESYCGAIDCNTARAGYNESKRLSESLCQSYRAQYGINCVTVRLSRCFGYDEKQDSKALAQFLAKAVAGEDIVLKSEGKQRYSYCYVADAAAAILFVLLCGKDGEAYNVADDSEGKTLGDYARLIASFAGRRVIFDIPKMQDNTVSKANYAELDCTKLKSLGWKPLYTVSEGLRATYQKYKNA